MTAAISLQSFALTTLLFDLSIYIEGSVHVVPLIQKPTYRYNGKYRPRSF